MFASDRLGSLAREIVVDIGVLIDADPGAIGYPADMVGPLCESIVYDALASYVQNHEVTIERLVTDHKALVRACVSVRVLDFVSRLIADLRTSTGRAIPALPAPTPEASPPCDPPASP